jgi:quercetin dioxygenase-like cupin family protein
MFYSNLHEWDKIPEKTIIPGCHARFIHSANMTFALWTIDKDALLPTHNHPHEQVMYLLKGEFEFTLDNVTGIVKAGNVAVIPSNTSHSGKAITECQILDVFYPLREDYINDAQGILKNAFNI